MDINGIIRNLDEHSSERFVILSKSIYALFDGDYLPSNLKSHIIQSFNEELIKVINSALDSSINIQELNTTIEKLKNQNEKSEQDLVRLLQKALDSERATRILEYFYLCTIKTILASLSEENFLSAQRQLNIIGLNEDVFKSIERDWGNLSTETTRDNSIIS